MTENKPIMIDELGCNNCPDKKRCDEQREHKDNIINSMLDDIKDTAIVYNCDLKDKIKNLKQNLPIITRCDVVLEKQLLRKTQECERKDKEIYELHIIIDRLLEASGYDKNTSTAEDFEDVYENMRYEQGLLDKLKAENELLKDKLTGLACFYETNKKYDKSCIERAKSNKCLYYDDDICRLDDIRNNPNRDCLRCIKESYLRLYSLNWDNQYRLIEENKKIKTQKEQAEKKLEKIEKISTELCKKQDMALDSEQTDMEESIDLLYEVSDGLSEILQIIDEVENE